MRRSVLAVVLTLLAGQAFALSNASNQFDSDWSSGRTMAPFGTGLTVNSTPSLTLTTPAHATEAFDVAVSTPTVSRVSPNAGPTGGGPLVTITGTGFNSATAVRFGAMDSPYFTIVSDTQITAVAAFGEGTVDVTVTASGGTSATSAADQFTYVRFPTVSGISPASGPAGGGTAVTITGTNFASATEVRFGPYLAAYTIDSDTQITATSPSGRGAGTVDISVTNPGSTSIWNASDRFTYAPSTDASLRLLALSDGRLSPAFASGTLTYAATVPNSTAWITARPITSDFNASVKVNGTLVTDAISDQVALAVGDNTVTVEVTAEDGTTVVTYTVIVSRDPATLGFSPAGGSFFNLQTGQGLSQQFSATGGIGPIHFRSRHRATPSRPVTAFRRAACCRVRRRLPAMPTSI
jgi:Cadherin-like beta sandwich domain/IPT/TIG domain